MPFHLWPDAATDSAPITRRGFLAGGAAAAAATLGAGRVLRADGPAARPWYALLSDTHIAADPSQKNRGQTMADNLRRAVDDVLAQGNPAGLLIDGDLALTKGEFDDYHTFLRLLEPVRAAKVPVHLALGNHDNRDHVREVVRSCLPAAPAGAPSDRIVSAIDGPGLRFLVLDSLVAPNSTPGRVGEAQLDWLAHALDAAPGTPAMVFVHHNPSKAEGALTDTEALLAVLRPRRQAKALVFGHTHVWDYRKDDGLYLLNLPAVAYPFSNEQPLGWCLLRPESGGATIQLRCHGGNRRSDRVTVELTWRA